MSDDAEDDGTDDVAEVLPSRTVAICLTVAFVVLVGASFGSCLYHCERQGDRRLRCVELTHDLGQCHESFKYNQ